MSELAIFPVTLGDSGVYTCQSVSLNDAGAVANVTVIVTSGKKIGGKIQMVRKIGGKIQIKFQIKTFFFI